MTHSINVFLSINFKTNDIDEVDKIVEALIKTYSPETILSRVMVKLVELYGADNTLSQAEEIITLKRKRNAWLPN